MRTNLAGNVHAPDLRLQRTGTDQRERVHRQREVVGGHADEPASHHRLQNAALREGDNAEGAAADDTDEELGEDDPPSPADACRSPHVDGGEPAHIESDGHAPNAATAPQQPPPGARRLGSSREPGRRCRHGLRTTLCPGSTTTVAVILFRCRNVTVTRSAVGFTASSRGCSVLPNAIPYGPSATTAGCGGP